MKLDIIILCLVCVAAIFISIGMSRFVLWFMFGGGK
jgi:hypothetical protein